MSALKGPLSSKRSAGDGFVYGIRDEGVFGMGTGEAVLRSTPAYSIESAYALEFGLPGRAEGWEIESDLWCWYPSDIEFGRSYEV